MTQTTTAAGSASVSVDRDEMLAQLNMLLRLTHTEETIAQVRRTQATSSDVERELARNAEMCRERIALLRELIASLGGVHDVFGVAVGRLGAAAKSQLEQGVTLTEALFTDLALEHQLLDRARFVRLLGQAQHQSRVVEVMERLELAHSQTVEWLESILAEVAAGETPKLRPTTAQAAVATGRRIAFFGARQAASAINRSVAAIGEVQHRVGSKAGEVQDRLRRSASDVEQRVAHTAEEVVDTMQHLGHDASEVLTAGRDAALARAEEVALEEGNTDAAETVRQTREALGSLRVEELPVRDYDTLNAGMASSRIEKLDSVHDVEVVLAYERANKNRLSVARAAENRISELTTEDTTAS